MMLFGSDELSLITQLWLIELNYAMFSAFWTTYNLVSLSLFSFHTIHGVRSLHNGLIVNVFERHSHTLSAANLWHCWAQHSTSHMEVFSIRLWASTKKLITFSIFPQWSWYQGWVPKGGLWTDVMMWWIDWLLLPGKIHRLLPPSL